MNMSVKTSCQVEDMIQEGDRFEGVLTRFCSFVRPIPQTFTDTRQPVVCSSGRPRSGVASWLRCEETTGDASAAAAIGPSSVVTHPAELAALRPS